MAIDAFAGTTPVFLPEQFFVGRFEGWAVVESLVGGLLKRATITAHGELDADTDTVVLTETYTFDDGHSDTLRWTIHKISEGQYTGHENRLEGEATGEQAGCAFHWRYMRDTPQGDGKSFKLNFDDCSTRLMIERALFAEALGVRASRSQRRMLLIGRFDGLVVARTQARPVTRAIGSKACCQCENS
ncbi:DUF3833 family protein [Bradyrhizobium sp. 1(2017)]|uniref:DUF3833 family protein n=1 Tax=Bradyrhizobium sp. 1(2017) TaxID=1404888 RepID=UPI002FE585A6